MSLSTGGRPLTPEEFQELLNEMTSRVSKEEARIQVAVETLEDWKRAKCHGIHMSSSQLIQLLSHITSLACKKALLLRLGPYISLAPSDHKSIVDLFQDPGDRAEVTSFLLDNNAKGEGAAATDLREDLHSLNLANASSNSNSNSTDVFPMPPPRPPATAATGMMQSPVVGAFPMELSSSGSDDDDSVGGADSSCNSESRGGSTLNSQEDFEELGSVGTAGASGLGAGVGSPFQGPSSAASVAPSVVSSVSGLGGGSALGGASGGGGGGGTAASVVSGTGEELNSVVNVVGSVATTLSSYDSTGSLSTIESSASAEVSQRRPFQHRSSLLKPVSEPPSGEGGGGGES